MAQDSPDVPKCQRCAILNKTMADLRHELAQLQTFAKLHEPLLDIQSAKIDRLTAEKAELSRLLGEQTEKLLQLQNTAVFMSELMGESHDHPVHA